jgi:hypothetical protein
MQTLARLRVERAPDAHVNHTLVKDGWCWWYRANMLPGIRNERGWRRTHERRRKACRLRQLMCRRGSEKENPVG